MGARYLDKQGDFSFGTTLRITNNHYRPTTTHPWHHFLEVPTVLRPSSFACMNRSEFESCSFLSD